MPNQVTISFKKSLCHNCRYCCYLEPVEKDPFYSSWCSNNHFGLVQAENRKDALSNIPFKEECEDFLSRDVEVINGIPVEDD